MTGDIIDFEQRRKALREAREAQEEENSVVPCPECGDTLFSLVALPEDASDEPYTVVCQHCIEAVGYAYFFPPDDETE
jgi:DNA-directed RNA polymerase subunit M/transcription elongation factor TFIIS